MIGRMGTMNGLGIDWTSDPKLPKKSGRSMLRKSQTLNSIGILSIALLGGVAWGLPVGRVWTESVPLYAAGFDYLAAPVFDSDSLGIPLLKAPAVGVSTRGAVEFRWTDSLWVRTWTYDHPTLYLSPVSSLDGSRHVVWNAPNADPYHRGHLLLAQIHGDQISAPDTIARLVRLATQYSAAVTPLFRVAAVSDDFRLRLFYAPTGARWQELSVTGDGGDGVATAALDDSTAVVTWTQGPRLGWGLLINGRWVPSNSSLLGGLPYTPLFRTRPSGGQWLAWATNDSGVAVASLSQGDWNLYPWLTPVYPYRSPLPGIIYLTKGADMSRDSYEFPALVFIVDSVFGETFMYVSVPSDGGFGVPEVAPDRPHSTSPTVARDRNGDVWVAWWDYGGTVWWMHTYATAQATRLNVTSSARSRLLTWTLTEPAPGSWWSILRAVNDHPFEVAQRLQAGTANAMSWMDSSPPGGIVRYRIRRECLDARYRWESEPVQWPSRSRRPLQLAASGHVATDGATELSLTGASLGVGHVEAFDLQGRLVDRREFNVVSDQTAIRLTPVGGMATGVYFVRAVDGKGSVSATSRIVVLR
jgi:hypothetical protein